MTFDSLELQQQEQQKKKNAMMKKAIPPTIQQNVVLQNIYVLRARAREAVFFAKLIDV